MNKRPTPTPVEVEVEAAGNAFGKSVQKHGTLFVIAAYDRKAKRFQCMTNVPPKAVQSFLRDFGEGIAIDEDRLTEAWAKAAGN